MIGNKQAIKCDGIQLDQLARGGTLSVISLLILNHEQKITYFKRAE